MDKSEMPAVAERKDVVPVQGDLGEFIREIDEYLGQTFDMMTQIDETYGKISTSFMNHANQLVGDRDYERLSKDEQTFANVCMVAALAVNGACAVVKGFKVTMELEKVKRLHRNVAETKYESLSRMIERAQRNHDDAAAVLARHNLTPFQSAEVRKNFQGIAKLLENELCQYRDVRFQLDMLLWLKDEYEAWLENRLYSDTSMPTMGQASVAAIYVLNGQQIPYSREKREKDLKEFGQKLADGMQLSGTANGKQDITSFELLAIIDSQLSAVLEHGYMDADPFVNAVTEGADDEDDVNVDLDKLSCKRLYAMLYSNTGSGTMEEEELSKNPVVKDSLSAVRAYQTMNSEYDAGTNRIIWSGILLLAAVVMPIWQLDWAWYWLLALSLLVAIFGAKFFLNRSINRMQDKLIDKFDMMSSNYRYHMAKQAGMIEPKSKVKEMTKSRNRFWAGLIIGGLIGLVGGPIGIVIGAIIGAILGSVSSDDIDTHGEGWQQIKICSPTKQWITIVIAALLVLFEIYVLFIK